MDVSSTVVAATPKQKPKRLYQVWKGNNRFFGGGRLIFGPDAGSVFLSTFLITAPVILFGYQIISKIHKHEKADHEQERLLLGYPVLFVTIFILLLDLTFLLMTSSTDPGIVPRNKRPPEADEGFSVPTPSMEWINGRTPHIRLPRTKDVIMNGYSIKVKYCDTCMLYRPPRASHCSVCNNCVQKFDHHCPWVGQCIGLRNYRCFFLFISTSTFLCAYVFTLSWMNIFNERKNHQNSVWESITGEVPSLVLILYTFITVWFVGGLTVFHTYLISTNQTTYENFRYRYDKKDNPYNKGTLKNFRDLFFTKIPPPMNNFRSKVDEQAIEAESHATNVRLSVISSKDKIDIEMGSKLALDDSTAIPRILQNLDYSSINTNSSLKERQDDNAFEPFVFTVAEGAASEEPRASAQSFGEGRELYLEKSNSEVDVLIVDEMIQGTLSDDHAARHS